MYTLKTIIQDCYDKHIISDAIYGYSKFNIDSSGYEYRNIAYQSKMYTFIFIINGQSYYNCDIAAHLDMSDYDERKMKFKTDHIDFTITIVIPDYDEYKLAMTLLKVTLEDNSIWNKK